MTSVLKRDTEEKRSPCKDKRQRLEGCSYKSSDSRSNQKLEVARKDYPLEGLPPC